MKKIVAVILNYMSYRETIDCVNLLKEQSYKNHEIVIVDNGSKNKSKERLHACFDNNSDIYIIESEKNLGFAKGNNLGIRYARNILKADYVFVVNSDILTSKTLYSEIIEINYSGVGVISPSVIKKNGEKQLPAINTDNIELTIKNTKKQIEIAVLLNLPIISSIYRCYKKIKSNEELAEPQENKQYAIQGCSYFLTPLFFKYYNELYPETFLYWEEIDLAYYLDKVGLKAIIVNTSPVIHLDGKSVEKLISIKKEKKKLKYSIESMKNSLPLFEMSYNEIKEKYNI